MSKGDTLVHVIIIQVVGSMQMKKDLLLILNLVLLAQKNLI